MSLQTRQRLHGAPLPPPPATASAGCQNARSSGTSVDMLGSPVRPCVPGHGENASVPWATFHQRVPKHGVWALADTVLKAFSPHSPVPSSRTFSPYCVGCHSHVG